MAIITGKAADGSFGHELAIILSEPAAPTDSVEVTDLIPRGTHTYIGVRMFDGAGALITAGATGEFTLMVKTANTQVWEAISDGETIDAAAPTTSSAAGPIVAVQVAVSGALAGVTTWRVAIVTAKT